MKRLSLLIVLVIGVMLLGVSSAQAYTYADVTGTLTVSTEQTMDFSTTSTWPAISDATLSNGDQVETEVNYELQPTCIQTSTSFCPLSAPTTNSTNTATTTETCTTSLGLPCLTKCPGPWYEVGYHGTVRYKNHIGLMLWKYKQVLWYYYCPSLYPVIIEKVAKLNSLASYTNYGWSWEGTVKGPDHNSLPDSFLATQSKGWFQYCYVTKLIYCENRYPWIKLYTNDIGIVRKMKWGIG